MPNAITNYLKSDDQCQMLSAVCSKLVCGSKIDQCQNVVKNVLI